MWQNARFTKIALLSAVAFAPSWTLAVTTTTVTFQNGVNGYTGTFDRKISPTVSAEKNGAFPTFSYPISGYANGISVDEQALMSFDGIFGSGTDKIPAGAFILDAKLQLSTDGGGGHPGTTGPYGVAGLLAPFDETTSYTQFGSRGAWWQDGNATRPTGGYGTQLTGAVGQSNVRPIVQHWSDGTLSNSGLVVQAGFVGTPDNWRINTTGHVDPMSRPKLSVTYTTNAVKVSTFQHGLNDYDDDSIIWMHGSDGLPPSDITADGLDSELLSLNGPTLSIPFVGLAMMKFNSLFGESEYQAPINQPVAKAWLVVTTDHQESFSRTIGPYSAHALLRPWDIDSKYSTFGPYQGVTEADGDIGPALDTQGGMISGSEVWFDVTAYVEGVRNGATDYGLAIIPGTDDDWLIHSNGSSDALSRPRLVIVSELSEPMGVPGDYNEDGVVNAADYAVWRDHFDSEFDLAGNGDESSGSAGVVDAADYAHWREHFGATNATGSFTSVPESPNIVTICILLTSIVWRLRRHN